MAGETTKTRANRSAAQGRFGRPGGSTTRSASQSRFGRPGASTNRPASQSRFGRPGGSPTRTASQPRFGRPSPGRTQGLRRRKSQPSGLKKMLGSVLPGAAAKKAAPNSKKGAAGGLALAAAAAGMAFKNRDKLGELRNKKDTSDRMPATPVENHSAPVTTPPVTPPI